MSTQRFTLEFKEEAVRQIVDRLIYAQLKQMMTQGMNNVADTKLRNLFKANADFEHLIVLPFVCSLANSAV